MASKAKTDDIVASKENETDEPLPQPSGRLRVPSMGEEIPEDQKLDGIDLVKINSIISSEDIQKGGFIRLERRGPLDQKFAYVCRLKPEDFDIDQIRKLYGGGDYNARTFRSTGQMYKSFTFAIDSRHKGVLDDQQIAAMAQEDKGGGNINRDLLQSVLTQSRPAPDTQTPAVMKMVEMMGNKSDQTTQMMMAMMTNMVTMMSASQENSTKMMVAMLASQKQSSGGGMEMVLAEILKQKATSNPVEEMLKMMAMAKELVADKPDKEEPPFWEKIATAAMPAVAGMLGGGAPAPQQLPPASPPQQVQPPPQDDMNQIMIRMFLAQVLAAAERNSDPGLYADMIFDTVSDAQLADIKKHLTEPGWPVNVFGDDRRVQTCRIWLDKLKQILLADNADSQPIPAGDDGTAGPVGG